MIDTKVVREMLEKGEIKSGKLFIANAGNQSFQAFKVSLVSWHKDGKNIVLKLKTFSDYPFGHKIIYRSLQELI